MSGPSLDDILAERHARLGSGQAGEVVDVDEPSVKLVIFTLAEQRFALPGAQVREILAAPQVYRVPGAPATLEGVISVRGEIESVLCLRTLLQLPPTTAGNKAVLLTRGERLHTGLRIDEVIDLCDQPESALQPAPDTLPGNLRPYVRHLTELGGRGVSLLDLEALLAAYIGSVARDPA
ncbi:chemotaxis protein CheW [Thiorhodovibrio winogradskyi]|nr:chemotaxis protein CheW [Thiorhodovibrio winogradskyi]